MWCVAWCACGVLCWCWCLVLVFGGGVVWCGVVWCGVAWRGVAWRGVAWCGVVWCGVVWCGVVWCGVVWCGVVWCGVVWCGVVWCGVVWCGVVWCGVVSFCVVFFSLFSLNSFLSLSCSLSLSFFSLLSSLLSAANIEAFECDLAQGKCTAVGSLPPSSLFSLPPQKKNGVNFLLQEYFQRGIFLHYSFILIQKNRRRVKLQSLQFHINAKTIKLQRVKSVIILAEMLHLVKR